MIERPNQLLGDEESFGEFRAGLCGAVVAGVVDRVGTALDDLELRGGGRGLRDEPRVLREWRRFLSCGVLESSDGLSEGT